MIRSGAAQFWSRNDGVVVTEIVPYPRFSAVNLWLVSGCLKDCLSLEPEIMEWALERGCHVATAAGRRGFGRAAAPLGWQQRGYLFGKELRP
jgi:hypothetical protein